MSRSSPKFARKSAWCSASKRSGLSAWTIALAASARCVLASSDSGVRVRELDPLGGGLLAQPRHRGREVVGVVAERRERHPRRRHLGVDLEGAPRDRERDPAGERGAGLLEADRPDGAPRSGVVAEDFDAHDGRFVAHGVLLLPAILCRPDRGVKPAPRFPRPPSMAPPAPVRVPTPPWWPGAPWGSIVLRTRPRSRDQIVV